MCSERVWWAPILLVVGVLAAPLGAIAQEGPGNNGLEFGILIGQVDFDREIRFENDALVAAHLAARLTPWWSLGVELGRMTARDRIQDLWQDVTVIAARTRVEPFADRPFSVGALMGVSFMAFQDAPQLDAISEGLDLGPSVRWSVGGGWCVRGELLLRMQTFNRIEVDAAGVPTGEPEETGYLWSRLWQLGVSHEF